MTRAVAILGLLLAGLPAAAADAPESANVRGESTTSRKRLAEAEQKILAGKTVEAVDELQRILDDVGDTLVTADGKQFLAARQYVRQFLAKLPAAELKKYRDRVEEPAAKLLALGRDRREPRPLLDLLDRYALSRPAEDANLLLAEMAYERGEFATAERYWKKLLPEADGYRYPLAKTPEALLRANLVLAAHARGDRPAAAKLFEAFRAAHPKADGRLAGRTGALADILTQVLAGPPPRLSHPPAAADWPTVGGSPSRDGRVPGVLPRHWPSQPTWKTPIPTAGSGDKLGAAPPAAPTRAVAFHPVVVGDRAYIVDAGRVIAFDLRTGSAEVLFDPRQVARPSVGRDDLRLPVTTDTDFTLTAAGGRLYFRFGPAELFPVPAEGPVQITQPSALVCFAPPGQVVWKRLPPVDGTASWEGSPLVVDGHVLAAFVRSEGGRAVQAVACYRGDAERPLWVTDVCEAVSAAGRTRPELLTLAGRNVVFCSHAGVVAAVNLHTGRPAWAYRYPRVRRFPADGRHRDLSPPVSADGRVFVAPNDGDQLYAFDAETGRLLWQDGPLVFDHVLGAAAGKVVVTVSGPQRGVRAYDAATGSCDPPAGWRNHDDPFLPDYGRGLLSDDHVAWPTAAALYTLRLADGTVAAQPVRTPHGNLAYGRGVLVVATATEVWGYVRDGDDPPEPPRPRAVLAGALPPVPPPADPPTDLPPRLGSPAVLEAIADPPTTVAVNLGPIVNRSIVRVGTTTEIVRATGVVPCAGPRPTAVFAADGDLFFQHEAGLSRVDPADGRTLWTATLPDVTDVVPVRAGLVVRIGGQHLVAFDRATGRACWALDSRQRPRLPEPVVESGPRFLAAVAFEDRLLVQLSTGRRWLLDAATGKVLHEADTADRAWPTRSAIVADGPGRVTRLDAAGKAVWQYDAGREASLTGDAAGVRVLGGSAFVVVRRGHGTEIDRVSAAAGVPRWRDRPAVLPTHAVDPAAFAADDERLYVPAADKLTAFKLDTGRPAWSVDLPPAAGWHAVVAQNRLVLLPTHAVHPDATAGFESLLRFPHLRRLVGLLPAAADLARGTVPVMVCDPATGRVQQQLSIPAAGPTAVDVAVDGVWIAAGGALYRFH